MEVYEKMDFESFVSVEARAFDSRTDRPEMDELHSLIPPGLTVQGQIL
jgi:hypothetical protein